MRILVSFITVVFALAIHCQVFAAHGISIDGKLKYREGFKHFDYTSAQAEKGGDINLYGLGSFDKMNPYTLKGIEAAGLSELLFESLTTPSLDEPFAAYGLLAEDIVVADDRMSVTFTLNPNAKFSDNSPVTPEDVAFSLETLKSDKAHPFYQAYYHDISKAEILNAQTIRFHFGQKNRELHMIAGAMPVFSKKFYTQFPFDTASMETPIGSGPYVVDKVNSGKSITYKKNPNYWGKDLPVQAGRYNFDTITFKYYKDQIIALEAFKAGEFDFMSINIAKQWARDMNGPKFEQGLLQKEALPHQNNAGMQAFVFNIRKPLFQDRRVRKALTMAFNFEWANEALFFNQYTRCNSYFSNSYLAASGLPQGLELQYLEKFREQLPPEVFTTPLTPYANKSPNSMRQHLRNAKKLLTQAGWKVKNGVLQNNKGEHFKFEILLYTPSFERVIAPYVKNLKILGINADYRRVDPALYVRRHEKFEFDMTVKVFGQSQSPGNEQRNYWHSSSADQEGSQNLIGLKNPVVDELVDKIIYAETQEELTAAAKSLDRVLWHDYYVVPNWYLNKHRLTFKSTLKKPKTLPLYYSPMQALMTWWIENSEK